MESWLQDGQVAQVSRFGESILEVSDGRFDRMVR